MDDNAEKAIDDATARFSHALRVVKVKATKWGEHLTLQEVLLAASAITLSADLEAAAAALGEIADGGVFAETDDDNPDDDNPLA